MDTTDPDIAFDEHGICHHCRAYDVAVRTHVLSGEEGQNRLGRLAERIRKDGKGKDYDCVIGVSGGIDSTYVAYKVKELGLRPLAVHLDNGWDSELAVKNIERTLTGLKIDLQTHVIDWEEFRDLQLAFLKASTPDSEIPTDHAIVALMRQTVARLGLKYVIFGCNVRSESHLPPSWSQGHWDWRYIKSVHRRFGTHALRTFPHLNLFQHYRFHLTQEWIDILNYVEYSKSEAKTLLARELGWRDYGGKHFESIYTRFYQGYILPKKFGYDKRKMHFSSLICSRQMERAEAIEALKDQQEADLAYVVKKLGITHADFDEIMRLPEKSYWDYPSSGRWLRSPVYQSLRQLYHRWKDSRDAHKREQTV
jgi:N-acetyl sugar amidotransferase